MSTSDRLDEKALEELERLEREATPGGPRAATRRGSDVTAPAHDPKRCTTCGAPILWAQVLGPDRRTVEEKPDGEGGWKKRAMPVDFHPDPIKGNVVVLDRQGTVVAYTLKKDETPPLGARLRTAHHMTCPDAAKWRGKKGRRGRR
jgi:hypothetical protein